jgi:hypothetical protein
MAEAEGDVSQLHDSEAGIYTETLARLYLKQGFVERALAIYRRLAQEQPENHQLHARLCTLEQELALGVLGQDTVVQQAVPEAVVEIATRMAHRQEHQVVVQLERWLHYLQQQRQQREHT